MNAVITGATRGIGRAIAQAMASAGYNLAVCSRNPDELEKTILYLQEKHPSVTISGIVADCSDRASLQHFINFVHEQFSVTDVLVNNAGMYLPADLLTEADTVLESQWALNLLAPYVLSKAIGRQMRDRRSGHIINMCSVASLDAVPGAGSYSITKFALLGLTKALREELAEYQVKVTAIIPGSTYTSSWEGDGVNPETMILPGDIASVVLNCLALSAGACPETVVIKPLKKRQ